MFIRRFCKSSLLLMAVVLCGTFVACGDDEEGKVVGTYNVEVMTPVVANGDNLNVSFTTTGDVSMIKSVRYYWDGSLIQSTDGVSSLSYPVNDQKEGDHLLKIEISSSNMTAPGEYYVQVYHKEKGFFGCTFDGGTRTVRQGHNLSGNVVLISPTSGEGYMTKNDETGRTYVKWDGSLKEVKIWIDDDEDNPVQIVKSSPWRFNIPVNNLSKGQHKLTIKDENVGSHFLSLGAGGGASGTLFGSPISYTFTVTE